MKKSRIKIVSNALLSASLRGLAFFAVFGMALYTYAAVNYPDQPTAVTGVVGLYVGRTSSLLNGDRNGYSDVNTLCDDAYSGSHVCTAIEMINTYNHNPTGPLSSESESLWINNGPPGYISDVANDCGGWQTRYPATYGAVWDTSQDASFIASCYSTRRFACCR
jgi:hypothetical protein